MRGQVLQQQGPCPELQLWLAQPRAETPQTRSLPWLHKGLGQSSCLDPAQSCYSHVPVLFLPWLQSWATAGLVLQTHSGLCHNQVFVCPDEPDLALPLGLLLQDVRPCLEPLPSLLPPSCHTGCWQQFWSPGTDQLVSITSSRKPFWIPRRAVLFSLLRTHCLCPSVQPSWVLPGAAALSFLLILFCSWDHVLDLLAAHSGRRPILLGGEACLFPFISSSSKRVSF